MKLSPEQIARITGKVQPAAQIRHLRKMGIRAERSANPDEPVCVLEAWLNGKPAEQKPLRRSQREQAAQA